MTRLAPAACSYGSAGTVAQRRRARRYWASVGAMQRFDDRRFTRTLVSLRGAGALQAAKVSARIFRGM